MTALPGARTRRRFRLRRSIIACLAGSVVLRCAESATGVLLGLYLAHIAASQYDISATVVGFVAGSAFLTELGGAPFFGALSDRWGRKVFILLGPLLGAIAVQMTALTSVLGLLLITRLLEGLSTASTTPPTLSYLSAITTRSPALRGRVMAAYEVASTGGMALGAVVAGFLWDGLGAAGFTVLTALYMVSLGVFAWGLQDVRRLRRAPARATVPGRAWREYATALLRPRVLRFVPAWLLLNAVVGVWFTHTAFQMANAAFPDQVLAGGQFATGSSVGLLFGAFIVLFVVGILLWGNALSRWPKTTVMLVALSGLGLLGLGGLAVNHSGGWPLWAVAPAIAAALGGVLLVSGFPPAALGYLADISEADPAARGTVMGLYSVLLGVGHLLGGWLGGPFADWRGMDGLLVLSLGLAVLAAGAVWRLRGYDWHSPAPERAR
ncbi:MAG: MFS transporter [Chloroflexi bacterium]|nr:MFS transporter [Chloroflexota bacterium]